MSSVWHHIGVDPAPRKDTVLWSQDGPRLMPAAELKQSLADIASVTASAIVAWDAPLSFDPVYGFYDRPIDHAIRTFIEREIEKGTLAQGAVAALPFAGCSHWAITCSVVGTPFSSGPDQWTLCGQSYPQLPGRYIVEVHPAVALAFWWIQARADGPMPRYKKGGRGDQRTTATAGRRHRNEIQLALKAVVPIPDAACATDDQLDAWVAWHLLTEFAAGRALPLGVAAEGAYLLPTAMSHGDPLKQARVSVEGLLDVARTRLSVSGEKRDASNGLATDQ